MTHTDIEQQVRTFIEENFLFRGDCDSLSGAESLIEAGLVDSTGVLELVAFLETEFDFTVADVEIVPENLDSIQAIVAYIVEKVRPRSTGGIDWRPGARHPVLKL